MSEESKEPASGIPVGITIEKIGGDVVIRIKDTSVEAQTVLETAIESLFRERGRGTASGMPPLNTVREELLKTLEILYVRHLRRLFGSDTKAMAANSGQARSEIYFLLRRHDP